MSLEFYLIADDYLIVTSWTSQMSKNVLKKENKRIFNTITTTTTIETYVCAIVFTLPCTITYTIQLNGHNQSEGSGSNHGAMAKRPLHVITCMYCFHFLVTKCNMEFFQTKNETRRRFWIWSNCTWYNYYVLFSFVCRCQVITVYGIYIFFVCV